MVENVIVSLVHPGSSERERGGGGGGGGGGGIKSMFCFMPVRSKVTPDNNNKH